MKSILLSFTSLFLFLNFFNTADSKYLLNVEEKKIIHSGSEYIIPVELKNSSRDTLYHYEMSCSWQEHYKTSNDDLIIIMNECDKNHPRIMQLRPLSSQFVYLKIKSKSGKFPKKIKIGFNLIESSSHKLDQYNQLKLTYENNFIWSNVFKIRASRQ